MLEANKKAFLINTTTIVINAANNYGILTETTSITTTTNTTATNTFVITSNTSSIPATTDTSTRNFYHYLYSYIVTLMGSSSHNVKIF